MYPDIIETPGTYDPVLVILVIITVIVGAVVGAARVIPPGRSGAGSPPWLRTLTGIWVLLLSVLMLVVLLAVMAARAL